MVLWDAAVWGAQVVVIVSNLNRRKEITVGCQAVNIQRGE
jgi:hypothetical protein